MVVHLSPAQMNLGYQTNFAPGRVTVRSCGDTLTMAGLLAVAKAIATYFTGVSGGSVLGGYPTVTPIGGAPPLPSVIQLSSSYIQVGCKIGDEVTLLNSLVSTIQTGGNSTITNSQKQIPGPISAWGE